MGIGPIGYSAREDVAAAARDRLDDVAAAVNEMAELQRTVVGMLLELWPTSAWLAAGATSAKAWLLAYTPLSWHDAHQLERVAELCHAHPELAEAVVGGELPMKRAVVIGRFANAARAGYLGQVLGAFLALNRKGTDDEGFAMAVRYWADRVDEHTPPRTPARHTVAVMPSLFGGGEIHGQLSPSAFANVVTAIDAFTQDPDPSDAPYRRSLGERRADALDDMASAVLSGGASADDLDDLIDDERGDWEEDEELRADDVFDGSCDTDLLDEQLAGPDSEGDPLDALRRHLRAKVQQRRRRARRRTRARSGVTVNAVVDLATLLGLRDEDDLDGVVMRGEGFTLTRSALERLMCDSGLLVTLFSGRNQVLDANARTEQFTKGQRRAMAARDGHCVFPSCHRAPRFCDAHHLHHRAHGGQTRISNGALLCRFHHRLVHELRWRIEVVDGHWIAVDPHGRTWTGRPAPPAVATAA